MRRKSDWEELADLTMRLDELRSELDAAEAGNKIAAIYALEEAIAEAELTRTQVLSRLTDRVAEEAALKSCRGVTPRIQVGVAADPDRAVHAEGERRAGEDQARVGPHIAEQERDEGGAAGHQRAQHRDHGDRNGRDRALEETRDVRAVGSAVQAGEGRKPDVPHGLEEEVRHTQDPEREGLVIASGDCGHGFKFAPVLGEIIADAVEEKSNPILEKFRWRPEVSIGAGTDVARFTGRE